MRTIRWLMLGLLIACGGDDDGDDGGGTVDATEDAPDVDAPADAATDAAIDADIDAAAVDCPTWESCEQAARPGVLYQDGCAPVACALWRYQRRDLTDHGESISMGATQPAHVAYVATQPARQLRMATRDGPWNDELVATVAAAGPTRGTSVVRINSASTPMVYVAWAEADGAIGVARRLYEIVAPPPWTVTRNVASGSQPVLLAGPTQPILVYAVAGGVEVRTFDGAAWSAPTSITADVATLAASRFNDGFENILVAWRTPSQEVRYARSRNGMPFVAGELEVGLAANPDGASIAINGQDVLYSIDGDTSVQATLTSAGTWQKRQLGHFPGQGRDGHVAQSPMAGRGYTSVAGIHAGDFFLDLTVTRQRFAEQVVSNRCAHGTVAAAPFDITPHITHACDDGRVYVMQSFGELFPAGWHDRCLAVAGVLADTARSCVAGGQACVIRGGMRLCGTGGRIDDLAYAQVCGDPTVDPAIIDACETAAAAVTCVADGADGTATVPAACSL